ncbi:MAG TPA: electron transfer flavoprotein subunit beta/FixA family protein [Pseudobdellovibrionaceae bacterium]|nr:electron transfer flavoprotein subunit beta/FixA family protein [Pseudobdellovibrionaceae bacterium]
MKIFVCLKQVPDTEAKIKIKPDKSGIDPTGVKWVVNPYDEHAIEEAVKLREKNPGAQVWALSLGPKQRVVESLRTALAMGADEAIVINTDQDLDSQSTAKALAHVLRNEGAFDLILTGKLGIDDNQSSVTQMLSQFLECPHVNVVSKIQIEEGKALVERDIEGGSKELIEIPLPCVLGANKGLNMPRYASLPGIMKAKKKVIKEIELSSLGLTLNKLTTFSNFELPAEKPPVKFLTGDSSAQSIQLVQLLRDEAKVL